MLGGILGLIFSNVKCNICHTTAYDSNTGRLVKDHNHTTGMIRGYLCDLCNSYLNLFERKQKGNKTYRQWVSKYKVRINNHLSHDTGIIYGLDRPKVVNRVGYMVKTNSKLLCKQCLSPQCIEGLIGNSLKLKCGHLR